MSTAILALMGLSLFVQLIELGISLDKRFKHTVEEDLRIPEDCREP